MVFGIWVPILVACNIIVGAMGTDYNSVFDLPASDSKDVMDTFKALGNKEDAGYPGQIVFSAKQGNTDADVMRAMNTLFAKVDKLEGVKIVTPYVPEGMRYNSPADGPINKSGADISFAQLFVSERPQPKLKEVADTIKEIGEESLEDLPGINVEYGGIAFTEFEFPESELLGVIAAVVILLFAFGSVIAMGLPILTALIGLGVGIALVGIASNFFGAPDAAPQTAAMIGLGVGIDYALFIVTRYKEHLNAGLDPEEATVRAVNSAGRAVVFAATTVMISLLGLFVMGLSFVRGMAVAGSTGVLLMMMASITLLPAFLGFTGRRIYHTTRAAGIAVGSVVVGGLAGIATKNVLGFGALGFLGAGIVTGLSYMSPGRGLRTLLPERTERPREEQFWYRWSRFVQRRPWIAFVAGVVILLTLGFPLLSIRLGFSDTGNAPKEQTVRRAYDMVAQGFGPGANGPLLLLSTGTDVSAADVARVDKALASATGVAFATPGDELAPGTWTWQVSPTASPQDEATTDLVHHLRDDVIPSTGVGVKIGGFTAGGIDFATFLVGRLPYLIGAVLVLSFLLLMLVFRSILVPLKAVVMNMLSVGAAYGVIVAIFQWGWGLNLIGVSRSGPIEAWAPMLLFAIVFGLSMDYEVFLLSRMKEEFDRTGDNATAVADGLAITARVITAAALIMVCVFSAFVLGNDRSLKVFGLGLAAAVFVDATVVRMVLVPATMELLGARNWWIPAWLDGILPHVHIEGDNDAAGSVAPATQTG